MHNGVPPSIVLAQFMNLGMTIVAAGDAVIRSRRLDLPVFQPPEFQTLLLEAGLKKAAAATAAIIVGSVGLHVDEIFFPYNRLDYKAEVFRYRIAIAFTNDLAGILDCKLDFKIIVPVGIDLQFAFTNPFGVIFIDILYLKVMLEVEFFQSGPDRERDVPSFCVEKRFTPQLIGLINSRPGHVLPGLVVG